MPQRYKGYKKITETLASLAKSAEIENELRKDLDKGLSAKDLREKYMSRLTAKSILIALTSDKHSCANNAIRDIVDREEGRPVEKKEIRHHLENLSDQEVQALLLTEIDDLKSDQKLN